MTYHMGLFIIDASLMALMSLVAIIAFVRDKGLAEKGAMRTKEKTLLELAVLDGAFGAFIGRLIAHHKTNKMYFSLIIYLGMLLQAGVLVLLGMMAFQIIQ